MSSFSFFPLFLALEIILSYLNNFGDGYRRILSSILLSPPTTSLPSPAASPSPSSPSGPSPSPLICSLQLSPSSLKPTPITGSLKKQKKTKIKKIFTIVQKKNRNPSSFKRGNFRRVVGKIKKRRREAQCPFFWP